MTVGGEQVGGLLQQRMIGSGDILKINICLWICLWIARGARSSKSLGVGWSVRKQLCIPDEG